MKSQILKGDVLERISELPDGSFDGCFCDPPYGIRFMGKQWDHGVPSADVWTEVLRVLKPGAHLLAFGGTRTFHRLTCAIEDAGFDIRDCLMWLYGQGFPKGKGCLKPSWEPCILAAKVGDRVLNIDASRIAVDVDDPNHRRATGDGGGAPSIFGVGNSTRQATLTSGRWPANLILEEESAALLDEQSGFSVSKAGYRGLQYSGCFGGTCDTGPTPKEGTNSLRGHNDSGGASRFFYCAKVSKRERQAGLSRDNNHPTLKPIDLCRYLAKTILPPEGQSRKLLIPYSGTGSEMIGALKAGWHEAVGIEQEQDSCEIAEQRINHWMPQQEQIQLSV